MHSGMNRSEISNDFNFEYELDVSNNRKDRTDGFEREGIAFEDFMNVGDRTMKSDKFASKIQHNLSELSKKEHEGSNIMDQLSTTSAKRRLTRDELIIKSSTSYNLSVTGGGHVPGAIPSPKFAETNYSNPSLP